MNRVGWNIAIVSCLVTGSVFAEDKPISRVRQAAIEKMQSKLGSLRGTIKNDSPTVFLTNNMIDNLKPIRSEVNTQPLDNNIENTSKYLGIDAPEVDTAIAPLNLSPSELLRAAGYNPDDQS